MDLPNRRWFSAAQLRGVGKFQTAADTPQSRHRKRLNLACHP
jgi:hypothetical protein